MKKLLLLTSLLVGGAITAQTIFHKAYHRYNDIGANLVALGGKYYFTSTVITPKNMDSTLLYCVDTTGKQRFVKVANGHEITLVSEMIKTHDDHLIMVGAQSACDYADTNSFHFIVKLDTTGNTVFKTYFDMRVSPAYSDRLRVAQMPDSSYFVVNDSLVYHFSQSGQLIKRKNLGFSGATAICPLDSTWLLCSATFSGGIGHIRFDTSLTLHPATPVISQSQTHQYMKTSAGSLVAFMSDGTLQKFSPQMVPGASLTALAGEATLANDLLYLVSANHAYRVYDTAFNLSYSANLPKNLHTAGGIQVSGGQAAILTNGASSTYTSLAGTTGKFFGLTAFPRVQNWAYTRDIGVSAMITDSAYFTATSPALANVHLLHAHFQFRAIVKNYGTDTVKQFYLNCNLAFVHPILCGPEYYREYVNGPPIAPGSTIEVLTKSFIVPWVAEIHNAPIPASHAMNNVALYTTVPDMQFDANNSNDAHSIAITAPVIIGIMENRNDLAGLNLFPNPASETLQFSAPTPVNKIEVIDGQGRLVKTTTPAAKAGTISVTQLPSGIYYIRMTGINQVVVRKFAKE